MRTALAILRRDLLRLFRNPIAAIVALGVCIVPCLYAWINIAANWDPYENTSDIPVAVVNEDTSAELQDMGSICVGDMLVDALKENDKIGWQFMGQDEALDKVYSGECYAAIVIPSDFTQSLTGVLDGKTNKAHLKYYVNEKVNAIAPKVTDTGASTIETQVDEQFVATAGEVIAQKLGIATNKLTAGVDQAAENIATALDNARTTLGEVDGKLNDLSQSLANAKSALNDATSNLASIRGKGAQASNAINNALSNFDQTRNNANSLVTDINTSLGNGATTVSSLSAQANHDISSLVGDIAAARSEVAAAIRTLEKDLTDNEALTAKVTDTLVVVRKLDPEGDADAENAKFYLETTLENERDLLVQVTNVQSSKLDELRALSAKLDVAGNEILTLSKGVNDRVQSAAGILQAAQNDTVSTSLSQVNQALDSFVEVGRQIEAAAELVDPIIAQTITVASQLNSTIDSTTNALGTTRDSLASINGTLEGISNELATMRASTAWSLIKRLANTNPEGVKEFLTAPVQVSENPLYPVKNYATGVAPFFTSLALWVGGIALVAIFKLEVDEEEVGRVRPWQAYFGRWALFIMLGLLQAVICCAGDLVLGIQCEHPAAFFLSAAVASFTFINIIFALSVAFKHLGKAIAFTLIILQVPGSAGMYPIEMMPPFFQAIGPWLPFTYSNNAMREALAGFYAGNLAFNLLMLLAFVIPALLVGVTARSHLVNINSLFDRRLRETDHLMVSEPTAIEDDRFRLATIVKAIRAPEEYREAFEERSAAFEQAYPTLVRRGVLALLLVPLALFVLALTIPDKLPFIAALVLFLICIYVFLILVEYFHDRIVRKRALTDLSPAELEGVLEATLRDELMPYASIDTILEKRRERQRRWAERRKIMSKTTDEDGAEPEAEHDSVTEPEPSPEPEAKPAPAAAPEAADQPEAEAEAITEPTPEAEAPEGGDAQ